jgi:rhodanese-related sulfurtransferase
MILFRISNFSKKSETYEWNERRIANAKYTGRGLLERDIEHIVPDLNDEVVVYCAGGVRSVLAADALQKMGYRNVSSLKGGIGAWAAKDYPIEENYGTFSEKEDY